MALTDDPKPTTIVIVGVVGVLWLWAIVIGAQALYYAFEWHLREQNVYQVQPQDIRALRDRQLADMNGYRWIDESGGRVGIPVKEAMRLYVTEAGASQ